MKILQATHEECTASSVMQHTCHFAACGQSLKEKISNDLLRSIDACPMLCSSSHVQAMSTAEKNNLLLCYTTLAFDCCQLRFSIESRACPK